MEIQIKSDKLSAVLEYFLSLHEADEVSYMLTDEDTTKEDILNYLKSLEL